MQGDEQKDALSERMADLVEGQEREDAGDHEGAYEIAYKWLKVNPSDPAALCLLSSILINTDKVAIAYAITKHLTQEAPEAAAGWMNLGRSAADLWRYNESIRAYKRALQHAKDDLTKSNICVNIASTMVDNGRFREAEKYCRQALTYRPESDKARANIGFCQLANRDWAEGWRNYRYAIGHNGRYYTQYNNEPLWEKQKGKILIYGEQGLGDEISFSQMLPDMQKWCDENESQLVVDVQARLLNLMRRSFPDIEIHGSRSQKYTDFDVSDVEYSLPIAQLGEYFRYKDEQFTGKPYLKADPDRVKMWKHLFKSKKKPVIGIGWQGGIWKTAAKYRQLTLEQLLPVLESVDAHWVSLQYKPSGAQIDEFKQEHPDIDIVEYPATTSNDYDDTVAMIQAMDMIITMQTTTVHVAGGLGVPCWAFVPRTSQWRYGQEGEDFPWAKSVRIIRQITDGEWSDVMQKTGEELANHPGIQTAAGTSARNKQKLRKTGGKARKGRSGNGGTNGGKRPPGLRVRSQSEPDGDIPTVTPG